MKRRIDTWLYSLLIAVMLPLGACQDEIIELQPEELEQVPVKIVATHAAPVVDSRLSYTDNEDASQPMQVVWSNNDKIKVFVQSGNEWSSSYMAIAEGAGTDEATFAGYFPSNTADGATIWAFYPITAELPLRQPGLEIDLHRIMTDYGDTNELMYYDYMVAKGNYVKNTGENAVGGTVALEFEHQVSMLRLELTLPQTATPLPIHEIKVKSEDLLSKGSLTFDVNEQNISPSSADERHQQYIEFNSSEKPVTSTTGSTTITAYVAVMPTTLDAPLTISAEVGGDVYSKTLNFTEQNKFIMNAGVRYALQAELSATLTANYTWYQSASRAATEYLLKDEADLRAFSNITNGHHLPDGISQDNFKDKVVKLANDVELKNDWLPIGSKNQFAGTFDGQGHTISNLQIDKETQTAQGFFSTLSGGAVVKNLTIGSGRVVCYDSGGGIVGLLMQSRVINCTNKADVSIVSEAAVFDEITKERQDPSVGGIVGFSLQGVVMGCTNYGTVKSVSFASSGGIVGFNYPFNFNDQTIGATDAGGYVIACANHGAIKAGSSGIAAGIIGFNHTGGYGAVGCFNSSTDFSGTESKYAISHKFSNGNGCYVVLDAGDDSPVFKDVNNITVTTKEDLVSTGFVGMNEAIVAHNYEFGLTSMFYCPLQWQAGTSVDIEGYLVICDMGGTGGSTGDYGDGGKLGN